jgi:hypothetical protein
VRKTKRFWFLLCSLNPIVPKHKLLLFVHQISNPAVLVFEPTIEQHPLHLLLYQYIVNINMLSRQLLFDTNELGYYDVWRHQTMSNETDEPPDRLPNAFEYEDYVHWRYHMRTHASDNHSITPDEAIEEHGNPAYSEFILATKCKHPLHPAHTALQAHSNENKSREEKGRNYATCELALRCPQCILTAHMRLLNALTEKWTKLGAPWCCKNRDQATTYADIKKAYYGIKTPLANAIDQFRAWAEEEETWELAHPAQDISAVKHFSATQTVTMYYKHLRCPCTRYTDAQWENIQSTSKTLQSTNSSLADSLPPSRNSVSFTPETEDGSHRPKTSYRRKYYKLNPARTKHPYVPGPHACPTTEGWADTSFMNSYRYTIAQSRILLVERFINAPHVTYRDLNTGPSFGTNRHVDRLVDLLEVRMESMGLTERKHTRKRVATRTACVWVVEKMDAQKGNGDVQVDGETAEAFTHFYTCERLCGTNLFEWARWVGDVTEEEERKWNDKRVRKRAVVEQVGREMGENSSEEGNCGSDRESVVSVSTSGEGVETGREDRSMEDFGEKE